MHEPLLGLKVPTVNMPTLVHNVQMYASWGFTYHVSETPKSDPSNERDKGHTRLPHIPWYITVAVF